jgi:nitrogen regulatory protein PII-like uncharacterized protein
MNYSDFISTKEIEYIDAGFAPDESLYPELIKEHQTVSVTWACKRGRAALFFDTGLGKTLAQLTWADQVVRHTDAPVLILAPLAVSHQTIREGQKFGIDVILAASDNDVEEPAIYISNYEKLDHFDPEIFSGIVLDESSILKGMQGKIRQKITQSFAQTPYKLSCTATPSPNDYMELGTQAEFLGIMTQLEMLAMFFIHDGSDTSKWRLKGHGKSRFWEWLSTWAIFLRSPADLGFDGSEYDLPEIRYHSYIIETKPEDSLFVEPAQSLVERNKARKDSINERVHKASEIVNDLADPAVIWCHLNEESEKLANSINGAIEVKGSDTDHHKSSAMLGFADGKVKALVTKPKISGFGMNWQSSHHCVFVGLSDSWESFYQAIRRQWRFGQEKTVHVHIVSADTEGAVVENIRRKDLQHEEMAKSMMDHMRDLTKKTVLGATIEKTDYLPDMEMTIPEWLISWS